MTPDAIDIDRTDDRVLLEGPYSRRKELFLVLRAVRDFIAGFRALHFSGPCVTIFGSARVPAEPGHTRSMRSGCARAQSRSRRGCSANVDGGTRGAPIG
jgi:hypothetical protein